MNAKRSRSIERLYRLYVKEIGLVLSIMYQPRYAQSHVALHHVVFSGEAHE